MRDERRMELLQMAEDATELAGVLAETPGGYTLAMLFARYLRSEALYGAAQDGGRGGRARADSP